MSTLILSLYERIWISMECNSDSDSNSESDYDPDHESATEFDDDEVDQPCNLEPEPSVPTHTNEYECHWTPEDQLKAQINATRLRQLHADIKAQAKMPTPAYEKLPQAWPPRPFDVQTLPDLVQDLIHYFELF